MRCVEIYINGELACRAGGENVAHIHNILGYFRGRDGFQFSSNGTITADDTFYEHVHWMEGVELKVGDTVELKIVESDEVTASKIGNSYGTLEEGGVTKRHCSFCSREATAENGMLLNKFANICHACLRKHNPDKDV